MRTMMVMVIGLLAAAPAMAQQLSGIPAFDNTLRQGEAAMDRTLGLTPPPAGRPLAGATDDEIRAEAVRRGLIPSDDGTYTGLRCHVVGMIGENAVTRCD